MAREKKQRIATDAGPAATFQPFAGLEMAGVGSGPEETAPEPSAAAKGRVRVRRSTAHRGGKTVTVAEEWPGEVSQEALEHLARELRKACNAGGTLRERAIEIQGDRAREVRRFLEDAGFRVVGDG